MPIHPIEGAPFSLKGMSAKGLPGDEDRLKQACREMESVFLHQMIKAMRQTIPNSGLLGGGPGHELYQSLFDMEMSRALARKEGIGLGKVMVENFTRYKPSKDLSSSETEGKEKTDRKKTLDPKGKTDGTFPPTRP